MDKLFITACFLIPFENFFFAPSRGWAAIAPLFFFAYVIFNYKHALITMGKNIQLIGLLAGGFFITFMNYFFMEAALGNLVDTMISVTLGMFFYTALDIYFIQKKRTIDRVVHVILIAYSISIVTGLIQFVAIKTSNPAMIAMIMSLEKRNYIRYGRVQFTITEPSFIGMHMFGILLPLYLLSEDRRIKRVMILYIALAIMMGCGVRIIVDTAVYMLLYFFHKIDIKKTKTMMRLFIMILAGASCFLYVYNTNYRVRLIVNNGIYADASLAVRWFRINASLKGYDKNKVHTLFGYGYGNALVPLQEGYDAAKAEYKNPYTREMESLKNPQPNESVLCMYIRIISELGFIVFMGIALYFAKHRRKISDGPFDLYFWMVCYLYIQFDSYAFYALWILLSILKNADSIKEKKMTGHLLQ